MADNMDIEDFYKDKFQNFNAQPAVDSFDKVLIKLNTAKRKKRRAFLFYILFGVSMVSLLIYFAVLVTGNGGKFENAILTHHTKKESQITNNIRAEKNTTPHAKSNEFLTSSDNPENQKSKTPIRLEAKISSKGQKKLPLQISRVSSKFNYKITSSVTNRTVGSNFVKTKLNNGMLSKQTNSQVAQNPGNSVLPLPTNIFVLPSSEKDVLSSQFSSSQKNVQEESPQYLPLFRINNEKDLTAIPEIIPTYNDPWLIHKLNLFLNGKRKKTEYFIGLNYTPFLFKLKYEKNSSADFKTSLGKNFGDFYLKSRTEEKSLDFAGIPEIKCGLLYQNKWELSVALGYYKLKMSEKSSFPQVDSSATSFSINIVPNAPTTNNNTNTVSTYKNEFVYLSTSAQLSRVLDLKHSVIKPGIGISFNNVLKSSYVTVDTGGYVYNTKTKINLNRNPVNITFRVGIAKMVAKNTQFQITPVYGIGLNSIFDKKYFINQKLRGFGVELGLNYTLPKR